MRRRRKRRLRRKKSVSGNAVLLPLGAAFLATGLGILVYMAVCWKTYFESSSWEYVPARIHGVELKSGGEAGSCSVACRYTYEFRGRKYTGTRVGIMGGSSTEWRTHSRRCRVLKEHMEAGKPYPALVNPRAPEQAILFREPRGDMYVLVPFALVFVTAGAAMVTGGVWWVRKRRRKKELSEELGNRPWLFRHDWREMRVRASTAKELAFAWLWGGGASLFVSMFLIGFRFQDASLPAKVVVGIFSLIAAALFLRAVLFTVRQLIHGTPELFLNEIPVIPGRRMVGAVRTSRQRVDPAGVKMALSIFETRPEKEDSGWPNLGGETTSPNVHGYQGSDTKEIYRKTIPLDSALALDRGPGTLLPVVFDIPAHLPESFETDDRGIAWKLRVTARAFPVTLNASFDLPVFSADESEIRKRDA